MPKSLTQEVGLLRALATHLERRSLPVEGITQNWLRKEGVGHVREKAKDIICIRMPGHYAFTELTDCLLNRFPFMERGSIYADIQDKLFSLIEDYVGREPSSVKNSDAEALVADLEKWFADKASPQHVFVPCVISRTPAPRFEIGPVTFEFIDRVTTSDFYAPSGRDAALDQFGFDRLVQWMREEDANWLARVLVNECEKKRVEEIAELSVDLAIVALQLAAPYLNTRTMARRSCPWTWCRRPLTGLPEQLPSFWRRQASQRPSR